VPKLIILGSSNAVPSAENDNAHLAVVTGERKVLVDAPGNVVVRLQQAGLDPTRITDLVLTHFHPDHVGGVPVLLMSMWLMERRLPLYVHGLEHALVRLQKMMDMFGWEDWPRFYPVTFHTLSSDEMVPVLEGDDIHIACTPVQHIIPNVGLRIEFKRVGKTIAYSSDTEPCPQVIRLAEGVDVLLHEASGPFYGHSSAEQAGEVAREAKVKALYLVHYPTGKHRREGLVEEAKRRFLGPVYLGQDLMSIDFE
jgi:ribonuclease Z